MKTKSDWAPGPELRILAAERQSAGWVVTAEAPGSGCCPTCDRQSRCRHGWYVRHLQDLPVQGAAVSLNLKVGRWRCRDPRCHRRTFTTCLPLWCTDTLRGVSSPSADMSAEPSGDRHAEPRHPVEHVAADFCLSPLIGQSPGVKASSDNGLVTIHSGFHQAAAIIA